MNDDGYTLAEALAALLMIGLAVGGLIEGLSVLGRIQGAAAVAVDDGRGLRAASQGLSHLFDGSGPFTSDGGAFEGTGTALDFNCGAARCTAVLATAGQNSTIQLARNDVQLEAVRLRGAHALRFAFDSDLGRSASWPPAGQASGLRQTLKSVSVIEPTPNGDMPLVHARVWSEQAADCRFDMISQDCRR